MCLEVLVVGGCAVNFVDSVRVLVRGIIDAGVVVDFVDDAFLLGVWDVDLGVGVVDLGVGILDLDVRLVDLGGDALVVVDLVADFVVV